MSSRWIVALTCAVALAAGLAGGTSAFAQRVERGPEWLPPGVPTCSGDSPSQAQSRRDALDVVQQINGAAQMFRMSRRAYPSWQDLAQFSPVAGPRGRAHVNWGANEPLDGWRIHYIADQGGYVFTLSGVNDVCGITFVSDESARVLEGHTVSGRFGVVPLSTR